MLKLIFCSEFPKFIKHGPLLKYELWRTVTSVGNVAQPPLGKASGERVSGGQDPRPRIGSPVGN